MKITPVSPRNAGPVLAALVCVAASAGCTSVISSAYLRETWLDAVDHAAEMRADTKRVGMSKQSAESDTDVEQTAELSDAGDGDEASGSPASSPVWSPATLDEAVDEASRRLAESGGLNDAARGTLIATLKSTPRQDWLVVVEEFTAALAAAHIDSGVGQAVTDDTKNASSGGPTERGAASPTKAAAVDVAEPVAPMPPSESPRNAGQETLSQVAAPVPVQPTLAVQNACFASRVRAWGVVDRFETSQFQPGQELIVYFELDQLASRESPEGHTTRIDTVLRLVDAGGRRVHEWTFEPLEETCGSHRRDYFARYLVTLPTAIPAGGCRLEVVVTDTIAGRTANASLPLEVVDR